MEFEVLLDELEVEVFLAMYDDDLGSSLIPRISFTAVLLLANFSNTGDFFTGAAAY